MLSKVLCGEPFKPLGAPTPNSIAAAPIVPKDSKDPLAYEHRQTEIKLALNTLGSFDFSGHVLNEFVREMLRSSTSKTIIRISEKQRL
jgi:FKBP12-rapamycin complex-associated protein